MNEIKNIVPGLNSAAKEIFTNNKEKGFWDAERNPGELLMLVVTELAEAMEAIRKNEYCEFNADYNPELDGDFKKHFETTIKGTYEDEIADVVIRVLDLCGAAKIDIERHISYKVEYNKTRPHKHGKLL